MKSSYVYKKPNYRSALEPYSGQLVSFAGVLKTTQQIDSDKHLVLLHDLRIRLASTGDLIEVDHLHIVSDEAARAEEIDTDVMGCGKIAQYRREDGSVDYSLKPIKVVEPLITTDWLKDTTEKMDWLYEYFKPVVQAIELGSDMVAINKLLRRRTPIPQDVNLFVEAKLNELRLIRAEMVAKRLFPYVEAKVSLADIISVIDRLIADMESLGIFFQIALWVQNECKRKQQAKQQKSKKYAKAKLKEGFNLLS